jgi:tetratricopeptide (TPR) repeat protein
MSQFHEAEDRYKAGIEAKHYQDLPRASEHFRAAIALNPNHPEAYGELGAIAYALGNFEDAARHLRQAIDLDPHHGNAQLFLALTLGELKQHDAAEARFQMAILDSESPAVAYAAYGSYLGALSRPDAEQAFKSALERDPECILALRDYARLLASYDRNDEAEVLFKKALEIDPDNAPSNLRYGRFLSGFPHRCKEAVTHLRRALELDPGLAEAEDVLDALAEEQGLS